MVEDSIGLLYEPNTEYGHVARTVGEFASAAFGREAALIPRLASRVLLPAVATVTGLENARVANHPRVREPLSGSLEHRNHHQPSGSGQQHEPDATQ